MCGLPGGLSSSLICASLTPSAQRRSKDRSKGQLGELRADTDAQLHPESTRSFNPEDEETRVSEGEGNISRPVKPNVSEAALSAMCVPGNRLTSHVSCFLDIVAQDRSSVTGWRLMMPERACGLMDWQRLKLMCVHKRLSHPLLQQKVWL